MVTAVDAEDAHNKRRDRARLRVKDRERLREIIGAEDLIKRIHRFATATIEDVVDDPNIRMTSDQLSASLALLKKVLPDLATVEQAVDPEAVVISPEPMTPEAWAEKWAGDDVAGNA